MKPYGLRNKTRHKCQGHGGCAVCLEKKDPSKRRQRATNKRLAKEERDEETEPRHPKRS